MPWTALRAAAARHSQIVIDPGRDDVETAALFRRFNSFDGNHPWLEPGDWSYAWRSHFDFVVQAPLHAEEPLEPLFVVEFDGNDHQRPQHRRRDLAKNRLCAAAGLPLMRVDGTDLLHREHVQVVQWLAELWAAYEAEMPTMVAERDVAAEYARTTKMRSRSLRP